MTVNLLNESNYIVFLNNKLVKTALQANEEEGWVEIPDIASMSPLDSAAPLEIGEKEPEPIPEMKTKILFGKVEIKKLKSRQ